jgi:CubicO group peptidase (beta-lactamase class C family)
VAALVGDDVHIELHAGDDPLDEGSVFEIGSVTKTMTGLLVADAVLRGELSPETRVTDVLGVRGPAGECTIGELATHRSGLPRLPPDFDPPRLPDDPYNGYSASDLLEALADTEVGPKVFLYSNFAFMVLGLILGEVTGSPFPDLVRERLFEPLGMRSSGCPPPERCRVRGYIRAAETPWWTSEAPGAFGVGASIHDVSVYLRAHLEPLPTGVGEAIALATTEHAPGPNAAGYGWAHADGCWWHNGATGGSRSFVALQPDARVAVALLANSAQTQMIDTVGFTVLKRLAYESR